MNAHGETADVECGEQANSFTAKLTATYRRNSAMLEASALLLVWSLLVINEGSIRFIDLNPSQGLTGGRPSRLLVFLASMSEVLFGVLGFLVGASAFLARAHSALATKMVLGVQTLLGYFVFVVFVFVIPIVGAIDLAAPLEGLTIGETRFLITLGILTSFHFCLALQGGQFVFFARLIAADTGSDFLKQRSGARMRAVFWNVNLAMSGLWTLITGALIAGKIGGGTIDVVFVSPPNVGRMPGMTIVAGLLMIAAGALGAVLGKSGKPAPKGYYGAVGVVYLFALLNFGIAQFGRLGGPMQGPPAGAVALHNGLVFMTVFLGPYFVSVAGREKEEHEADMA